MNIPTISLRQDDDLENGVSFFSLALLVYVGHERSTIFPLVFPRLLLLGS